MALIQYYNTVTSVNWPSSRYCCE